MCPTSAPSSRSFLARAEGQKESTMAYRRRKDSDAWHWCRNCSNWPTSNYVEQQSKPTSGELDNECKAKEAAGNCTE